MEGRGNKMQPWRVVDTQWRVKEAQNGIIEGLQTSGRKSDNFEEPDSDPH